MSETQRVHLCAGFNWMVGVLKKIIAEATGVNTEYKGPPLIEFLGPEALKVDTRYVCVCVCVLGKQAERVKVAG